MRWHSLHSNLIKLSWDIIFCFNLFMEPGVGFEPTTHSLQNYCSGRLSYPGATLLKPEYYVILTKNQKDDKI